MTTKPDSQGQNLAAVACLNDPFPNGGAASSRAESPRAEPQRAEAGAAPRPDPGAGNNAQAQLILGGDGDDEPTLSDVITPLPGTLRQVNPLEGFDREGDPEDPLGLDDAVTRVTSIAAELAKAVESLEQQESTRVRPSESKLRTPPPPKPERRSGTAASRRITPRIDLNELKGEARHEVRSEPKSSRMKTPPPPKPLRALESRSQPESESRMAAAPPSTASGAFRLENGRIVETKSTPPPTMKQHHGEDAPMRPSSSSRLAVVSSTRDERPSSREKVSVAPISNALEPKTPEKPFNPYRLSTFVLPETLRGQLNALEPPSLTDADFADRETTPPPAPREPSEVTQVAPWTEPANARPMPPPMPMMAPESKPPASSLNSPSVQPLTFPTLPASVQAATAAQRRASTMPPRNVAHREARARRFVGLAAAAFGLSLLGFGAVTYLQSTDLLSGAESNLAAEGMALDQISDAVPAAASLPEVRVLAASPSGASKPAPNAAPAGAAPPVAATPPVATPPSSPGESVAAAPAVKPVPEIRAAQAAAAPAVAPITPGAVAGPARWQAQPASEAPKAKPAAATAALPTPPAVKSAPIAAAKPKLDEALAAKAATAAKSAPTVKPAPVREKTAPVAAAPTKGRSKSSVFDTMMAPPEE